MAMITSGNFEVERRPLETFDAPDPSVPLAKPPSVNGPPPAVVEVVDEVVVVDPPPDVGADA